MRQRPPFLDAEASSLDAGSYPIEIGWSAPDGEIEAYLIRVQGDRAMDRLGTGGPNQVHGISRAQLVAVLASQAPE